MERRFARINRAQAESVSCSPMSLDWECRFLSHSGHGLRMSSGLFNGCQLSRAAVDRALLMDVDMRRDATWLAIWVAFWVMMVLVITFGVGIAIAYRL